MDIGKKLQSVRKKHGLSQRELANRAGLTNGTIALIEQNKTSPSIASLKRLLDAIPMIMAERGTLNWYCTDYWSNRLALDITELKSEVGDKIGYRPPVVAFLDAVGDAEVEILESDQGLYFRRGDGAVSGDTRPPSAFPGPSPRAPRSCPCRNRVPCQPAWANS